MGLNSLLDDLYRQATYFMNAFDHISRIPNYVFPYTSFWAFATSMTNSNLNLATTD